MNDSLACYWNTPEATGAQAFLCWRKGRPNGKHSACRSIPWGQGNILYLEEPFKRGKFLRKMGRYIGNAGTAAIYMKDWKHL